MLQGFPVNYRFYGNRDAIRLQIGNAVPPPVSYAAGTAIINCLDTKQDKNHFNFQNPMELDKDGQFSLAI